MRDCTFRLYVAGRGIRSETATSNLRSLCESRLAGRHEIEVIDVTERPDLIEDERIIAAPTAVSLTTHPQLRLIGDLSDHDQAAPWLGLSGDEQAAEVPPGNSAITGHPNAPGSGTARKKHRSRGRSPSGDPYPGAGATSDAGPARPRHPEREDDAMRTIMSALADGIVAVDGRGVIRVCNPAAEELFARSSGELIGSRFGHPISADGPTDIDLILPGARPRVVEMRVTRTIFEGEHLYVAALRDATQRRRWEQQLETTLERERTVVAVAAHELRNPLAAISVLTRMLRDRRATLTEEQRSEIIDRIADRVAYLQALIRKLLTASRLDARKAHPPLERVPVLEVILENLTGLDPTSQDVNVSCSPGLVALADRGELSEMLANYLENAFAYGRPPIKVEAAEPTTGWAEIRVSDNGAGVPEEFVPHLFERFARGPAAEEHAEGSGLGLWIVRSLARANGGDAYYEPAAGGGACFCLRLRSQTP